MKRTLLLLLLGVGVCVTTPSYAQDLINGALTAMGGAEALTRTRPDQKVLDLFRLNVNRDDVPAEYTGICW